MRWAELSNGELAARFPQCVVSWVLFHISVLFSGVVCLSVRLPILSGMDSTSVSRVGHPMLAALDDVSDAVEKSAATDVWSLSDDDLAATIVACEQLAARQAALSLRLVREADARDLGRRLGASSTAG